MGGARLTWEMPIEGVNQPSITPLPQSTPLPAAREAAVNDSAILSEGVKRPAMSVPSATMHAPVSVALSTMELAPHFS